ncbi:MAG: SprB repeat-containing protein, partial [Saprospiraceae bacterium]
MMFRLYFLLIIVALNGFFLTALQAQCSVNTQTYPEICGQGNGRIEIYISGGVPAYSYMYDNGITSGSGTSAIDTFFYINNLSAGSYNVTVTDGAGCSSTTTAEVNAFLANITVDVQITNTCATSLIDVSVSGGQPAYSYQWSDGSTTQDLTNFINGNYSLTVTDAYGCSQVTQVTAPVQAAVHLSQTYTTITCADGNDGSINLSVFGGTAPYTYAWTPALPPVEDQTGLPAGTYVVTVTDMAGCTKSLSTNITQPPPIIVQAVGTLNNCNTPNGGAINLTVSGGTSPYSYLWSNGSTSKNIGNLAVGTYTVTVTDANGCTAVKSVQIALPTSLAVNPIVTYTDCGTATINPQATGGFPPYTYQWNYPFGDPQFPLVIASGTYNIVVTDVGGCSAMGVVNVELSANDLCGSVTGRVLHDTIKNCLTDDEPGLSNWIVQAVGIKTYYGITDATGQYQIAVKPGTYTLSTVPPNALWEPCINLPTVTLNQPEDTIPADDLLVQSSANCPALTVSIATPLLRRCMVSYYTVDYCNEGTAPAENAYVLVDLDPYLTFQSSSIPFLILGNGQIWFELGNLAIGQCGTFKIYVTVDCAAALGQTHCSEAHIYPDVSCLPVSPNWSGASLQVQSLCGPDSLHFTIKNVGLGNLTEAVNYIVIEDQVMLMQAQVPPLAAGESVQVVVPADGSTWRMEVQQVPFHPGFSQPGVAVEGCSATGTFTTGYVAQFPT